MNNFTFGDEKLSYYETIAGGKLRLMEKYFRRWRRAELAWVKRDSFAYDKYADNRCGDFGEEISSFVKKIYFEKKQRRKRVF